MDKIGYAIIGSTGVIGRVHIDAISQLDNCELVGVNARRQEPLREQASKLGVKCYPTLDEVLSDSNVDAVIIATPHPSHEDLTLRAAAAGKHLLVEKPLAVTVSEADAMVKAAAGAGVTLGVLFNQRFRAEAQMARQLIESGAIGEIYRTSLTSTMIRSQNYYDSLEWRGKWDQEGGGVLINQGIHAIDMFQWLGGMPVSVYGKARTFKHSIEVENYASALLGYGNGAHGSMHCTTAMAPNELRIELWGDEGQLVVGNGRVTINRLETSISEFIDTYKEAAYIGPGTKSETFDFEPPANSHTGAIGDFADAILEGREPGITGEEGIKSQELVAAVTLSSCRGKEVRLPVDRAEYDALMEELKGLHRLP